LETPTGGAITVAGVRAENYARIGAGRRRVLRRTIQMVFQDAYSTLNPSLTIGDILQEACALGGEGGSLVAAVRRLLDVVGLDPSYAARKPVALSGGERQRVAIARALAARPKVLVCDEPTSALDVSVQAQILNLFRSLQVELGVAFLFITHDLAVARQVTDRVYVLYRGRIVEHGPTERVLSRPEDAYTKRLVESIPRPASSGTPAG
jgi:peptide/nickel transport system ATP-binding protein